MNIVYAGSTVIFETKSRDIPTLSLINPDSVTLTLVNSLGTIILNNVAMTLIELGYFQYIHLTTIFDANGIYSASFQVTSGSNVYYIPSFIPFTLINGNVVDIFDYINLKDTDSNNKYFSLILDNSYSQQIIVETSTPTSIHLTARRVYIPTFDYLTFTDELGGLKYVLILPDSQIKIDTATPAGTGFNVGTFIILKGRDRVVYKLSVKSWSTFTLTPITYP